MKDPFLGERLGNYRLDALLGRGGMASVYRARHVALDTEHAVKVLEPVFARNADVKARFLREGRTQARLSHPGIARVTDTINGPAVALVMELLVGRSLREQLDDGVLEVETALLVLDDLAEALAHAHEAGVVHRDVKPDNIFLADEPDGSVRTVLLDFGVAQIRELSSLTRSGIMLGTPRYMSPEQIEDPRSVDGRADQFSLAVVLYEMLAGTTPHDGDSPRSVAVSMLTGRYRPLSHRIPCSPELDEVLAVALQADPAERFDSIATFAEAARRAARLPTTSAPVEATPSDPAPTAPEGSPSDDRPTPAPTWPPIPEDEVPAVLAELGAAPRGVPCPQCGAPVPAGRPFCRRCRHPM